MTIIWEVIARMYSYNPWAVPHWVIQFYGGVTDVCGDLSPWARFFYHVLGLCS